MSEKERPPLQLPFDGEKLKDVWFFPEGTMIWPLNSKRGVDWFSGVGKLYSIF